MSYFQGFVIPVKTADRQAYLDMAKQAAPVFKEHGATRIVECWGDEVMDGTLTDMKKAVQATADETIVFSWIFWPDKTTCDAASEKLMADERMKPDGAMPFDMQRMIFAGYDTVVDSGAPGGFGYVDAVIAAAPTDDRPGLIAHATRMAGYFQKGGATRLVDGWGADVPDGKITDFKRAVQATPDETVVFGWIEWPDKATRDTGRAAMMQDTEMRGHKPAWNGPTAIFGGFVPILDTDHQ